MCTQCEKECCCVHMCMHRSGWWEKREWMPRNQGVSGLILLDLPNYVWLYVYDCLCLKYQYIIMDPTGVFIVYDYFFLHFLYTKIQI